ncbi:copper amine oxidase N-terminal domain-containing protein [Paenibacillus endoradicis]|uniref:copper amine oxidase N-terminal domain-containing protein n=1 Tax=Paenibacillus endoradicis TaxID=2972487 RepID=UPI0021593DC7|nr:copper amine oxidase N-terminal domain-containing protein [Paenibacillus endoradicis]MCR8659561.1 copper amine oxidase N-terminal domain-containing protein [Paenibacillus endoradicis]
MKKLLLIVIICCLAVGGTGDISAAAQDVPMFKVNGKLFVTPEGEPAPYVNKDNRTMGSLRLIASALGVEIKNIKWSSATNTATLVRGTNTVSVVVGKKEITVNGKEVVMDTVSEMKKGRVFIPARYIAQGLGVKISYDSATGTVSFNTGEVAKHNFEDYGLTLLVELPLELTYGGLKMTVNEVYVYPTTAAEAKALDNKYDLWKFEDAYYLVWVNVTLENVSKKLITTDYRDMIMKVNVMNGFGNSLHYSASWLDGFEPLNDTTLLYNWVLKPGEKVTSNIPFLDLENKKLEFIGISVRNGSGSDYRDLAEKENK